MQDNRIASGRAGKAVLVGTTAMVMSLAAVGATGGVAFAQDKPASQVQEVVVTGSRIVKRDFTSNSPIVTVNTAQFENTANVAIDQSLQKLPQFAPAQNLMGFQAGDIQPTAINTPGIATASLRGLGSNRNLVLMDGRRLTPVNGLNVIDLNTIPTAAVDRVEVITGGASAVYGADAVAGVVNFILKKNFQGLDVDARYGVNEAGGDGQEFDLSALFGTNFADDKGNIMFGVEHYTRAPSYEHNRDFYTKGWADPTTGTNALFQYYGAQYAPTAQTGGCPSNAAYGSIFGPAPSGPGSETAGLAGILVPNGLCGLNAAFAANMYFNNDGTVWTPGGLFGIGNWATFGSNSPFKGTVNGSTTSLQQQANDVPALFGGAAPVRTTVKGNNVTNYLFAPLTRWSMFGQAHYEINDWLTVFANGMFVNSITKTRQLPTTPINGWGTLIPYDARTNGVASGHPVPTELATLLNSRTGTGFDINGNPTSGPNSAWQLNTVPNPNGDWEPARTTIDNNTNWQITAGLDGKFPVSDWTWELYGSHGQTLLYTTADGNLSLQRYRFILNQPNYGQGFNYKGNQFPPLASGFGAGAAQCTTGFYDAIFHNGRPSQDCVDALTVRLQSASQVSQDVVEFDAQGTLFDLPAGPLQGSIGASYRSDALKYTPDPLQEEHSFLDQVSGLYPAAKVDASVDAREVYGELAVPLLSNMPYVKNLSLELGARYSDYSNASSGWTYKVLGDYTVTDWLRIRGGYNLAVRAPTVAESFLPLQEVFGVGSAYGDPCSLTTNAPFGAAGAIPDAGDPTPPGYVPGAPNRARQSAFEICKAQMTNTGKNIYYAGPQPGNIALPFGWQNQLGNPNLNPEKGHTWTAGIVLRSPVQSPWLERSTLTVDWYRIKLTGAIGFQNPDLVNQSCYSQDVMNAAGTAVDPAKLAAAVASTPCQRIVRVTTNGVSDLTTVQYVNLGLVSTSGVDVTLNWGFDFDSVGASSIPGSVNVNVLFNWLDYYKTNSGLPNAWTIDWAGTAGPNVGLGVNQGAYKWKLNTTFTYSYGPGSLSLSWRHLPSLHPAGIYNAAANTVNNPTGYLSLTNTTLDTPSYDVFDLGATWNVNHTYSVRAGVENLLNTDPAITGATHAPTAAQLALPGVFPAVASSGQGTTNPGYYDALGRRFYVGVKARF